MISIGNQTSYSAALTEPFDYALAGGFDAFEWFPDKRDGVGWEDRDLDAGARARLRETARAAGMRVSVHARLWPSVLKAEGREVLREDLELAADLGAAVLNVHLEAEAGVPAFVEGLLPLARVASEAGVVVVIENTPDHAPELFNALFERIGAQAAPPCAAHLGMCLDVGHANLCAATRNDYLGFIDRLGPHVPVRHIHLHENWGDADTHLTLFTGPAGRNDLGVRGLAERLRRRAFSGSIILEQWPQPPSLLNTARDRLRQILGLPPTPGPDARGQPAPPAATPTSAPAPQPRAEPRPSQGPAGAPASAAGGRASAREPAATGKASSDDDDLANELVAADRRCRSWREKLDWVRDRLAQDTRPLSQRELLDVGIYLRFLGTGEIACAEDGRHFRPSHHARIALAIEDRLGRLSNPADLFLARRIYPWLPSTAQPFQRAEPLTRIRDIAHRNDIPQELKREIKQTLQNKLHRCAGPEDLVTANAILERITAPGADYSPEFVSQFKIFHQELKEFFGARPLEERLNALLPAAVEREAGLIRAFLRQKDAAGLPEQTDALAALTELRRGFLASAGAPRSPGRQESLLADIGLEDFAFVLLSRIVNQFDAEAEAPGPNVAGRLSRVLLLAVANVGLGSVEPQECGAIQSELGAWLKDFSGADRDQLLRLKATAERALRLAEDHSRRVMALFPARVQKLGRALGVSERAIAVFCEGEIRGHVVFQLSKLAVLLLRRLRTDLAAPAWDVLVGGEAAGRVRPVRGLEELAETREPAIALLSRAEGDEEIPRGVAGIVLTHPMPHLSHLGVRARQAGVVFVVCEDAHAFEELTSFSGRLIALTAKPEKVEWHATEAGTAARANPRAVRIPPVRLVSQPPVIELEQAAAETCGGKAMGARTLAGLARQPGAGFKTPFSWAIPFGVLEASLGADPGLEAECRRRRQEINQMGPAEFDAASRALRDLIGRVPVPDQIGAAITRHFGNGGRLIVRSSANCEDLPDMAGAGLYESVANVALNEIAPAVRTVWSSLWTRRAALSRRQAGIPHDQAHMAVLIQEMLAPDVSFVLHTTNPLTGDTREVYAEAAAGLGETLASAAEAGNPYRFGCDKESGALRTLAFANFSHALRPAASGGIARETLDYSRVGLSCDAGARQELAARLGRIGGMVEQALGGPQDIEGALVHGEIWLVQARPQVGG